MNEEQIRKIAMEVFNESSFRSQFSPSQTTFHTHNGIDSSRVNQSDLVTSDKYIAFATATAGYATLQVTTTPTSIQFYGFAANNADGTSPTKRAICNGNAQLGVCYTALNSTDLTPGASGQSSFIQASNSLYTEATDVTGIPLTTTGALSTGNTSATLTANWTYVTTTQSILFSNGDRRNVSLTNGSTSISWTGGLSSNATTALATVTNNRVNSSSTFFVYVADSSATSVATATIVSWDSQSVTINVALGTNWQITGGFMIT